MGAGSVRTGAVASSTVTVNDALPVLPPPSDAAHDTVVVPSGNVLPEAGAQLVATLPATASVADAA